MEGDFVKFHGGYVDKEKNFHVFDDASGQTWIEKLAVNPHAVVEVNLFFKQGLKSLSDVDFFPNSTLSDSWNSKIRRYNENATMHVMFRQPDMSFQTIDPTMMVKWQFRGTACCVDMNLYHSWTDSVVPVKVGLGHSVTPERIYFSFFMLF